MRTRALNLAVSGLALALPAAALAQEPQAEAEPRRVIEVIKIEYAEAEEVAALLAAIAPPGVTVIAYPPTNSVVIAGDESVLGAPEASDDAAAGQGGAGRRP